MTSRIAAAGFAAFSTIALVTAAQFWPRAILTVAVLVLGVGGIIWWRRLDRIAADYMKRYDRRPRLPSPLPSTGNHDCHATPDEREPA